MVHPNEATMRMIVIGTDMHKGRVPQWRRSRWEPAVCAGSERSRVMSLGSWRRAGGRGVWTRSGCAVIEDCRVVSRRLERALITAGERVVGVAPNRMGASRKGGSGSRGSLIRATRWRSRAVVKDGIDEFPVAYLDEQAMEIGLLLDHGNDLVAERTRIVYRLRWHLLALSPELERSVKARRV